MIDASGVPLEISPSFGPLCSPQRGNNVWGKASAGYMPLKTTRLRPSRSRRPKPVLTGTRGVGGAYPYAKHASEMKQAPDRLFVDEATYTWRALDEVAISAFYVGTAEAQQSGRIAADALLSVNSAVPESERHRIRRNRDFYITP